MATRRLFTAIEPPESFISKVTDLHTGLPGANWESRPHITLSHFGDVDEKRMTDLLAALGAVTFESFDLEVQQLRTFGEPSAPTVVWLGLEDSPELARLQVQLTEVRSEFAATPDRHGGFTPHITLARTQQAKPADVAEYLRSGMDRNRVGGFHVGAFELFESIDFTYERMQSFSAVGG